MILFASRYGKNFDADVKKWRYLSLFALCGSFWIEISALAFPQYFLLIASLANVGKNICFLLSSASRASIHLRFAKSNNIADIQGKGVSQFTASTLLGTGAGLVLSKAIDVTSLSQLTPCFLALSLVQMATTHSSCKIVDEIYLNNERANMVFDGFFESGCKYFMSCRTVNSREKYYCPSFLNDQ